MPPSDAIPGGFQGSETAIGAVKPGFAGDDLQVHRPAADDRHLRLDDLDRERGLLGHGHGERVDRPGPERDVVLAEDQLGGRRELAGDLRASWSTGLPVTVARRRGRRGVGLGREEDGDDGRAGGIVVGLERHPGGQVRGGRGSGRRRSRRGRR